MSSSSSGSASTPSSLHAFFVFNPLLGDEATEARKLLYFHDARPSTIHRRTAGNEPQFVDLNFEKDLCGVAEGLIAFTRDFAPEELCESVHCQQHRYAFLQAEKDYWMVIAVKNPTTTHKEGRKDANGNGGAMETRRQADRGDMEASKPAFCI